MVLMMLVVFLVLVFVLLNHVAVAESYWRWLVHEGMMNDEILCTSKDTQRVLKKEMQHTILTNTCLFCDSLPL
jgi:hypothetical protein